MFVRDVFKALLRRWYLVPLILAMTAGGVAAALSQVGPTYRATASVVLVPPETTLGVTGNPYLFLGGLEQSVDVLSRTLSSQEVREQVADAAGTVRDYEVVGDVATSAPIVLATAEGGTAAEADQLLDAVLDAVPEVLAGLQEDLGVKQDAQIATQVIARTERPEAVQKTRLRLAVLAAGAGGVLGLFAVLALDGLLLRRRRRRDGRHSSPGGSPGGSPGRSPVPIESTPPVMRVEPTEPPEPTEAAEPGEPVAIALPGPRKS